MKSDFPKRRVFTLAGDPSGVGSIYLPIVPYPYFLMSFVVLYATTGTSSVPYLVVEQGGLTLARCSDGNADMVDAVSGVEIVFDTVQVRNTLNDKYFLKALAGLHIALPSEGLYVPLNARCRFATFAADAGNVFQSAVAQVCEP